MTQLRQRASLAFAATVGFLAGMAVMAVISVSFRAGETVWPEAGSAPPFDDPRVIPGVAPVGSSAEPGAAARSAASPSATPPPAGPPSTGPAAPPPNAPPAIAARPSVDLATPPSAIETTPEAVAAGTEGAVQELRQRRVEIPVRGATRDDLQNTFADPRGQGRHEALDLLAPRHTPVIAVEDGTIAKLFTSKAGGITVYQFDPGSHYAYYYAHLQRYADGLTEGAAVKRGQVLGFVGTTGNAPADTPHLHFAIFKLAADKKWWQGTPIDPFAVLR